MLFAGACVVGAGRPRCLVGLSSQIPIAPESAAFPLRDRDFRAALGKIQWCTLVRRGIQYGQGMPSLQNALPPTHHSNLTRARPAGRRILQMRGLRAGLVSRPALERRQRTVVNLRKCPAGLTPAAITRRSAAVRPHLRPSYGSMARQAMPSRPTRRACGVRTASASWFGRPVRNSRSYFDCIAR